MPITISVTKILPNLSRKHGSRNITVHVHEEKEEDTVQNQNF